MNSSIQSSGVYFLQTNKVTLKSAKRQATQYNTKTHPAGPRLVRIHIEKYRRSASNPRQQRGVRSGISVTQVFGEPAGTDRFPGSFVAALPGKPAALTYSLTSMKISGA